MSGSLDAEGDVLAAAVLRRILVDGAGLDVELGGKRDHRFGTGDRFSATVERLFVPASS